jgi:Flp pilus assembly pilin Flp
MLLFKPLLGDLRVCHDEDGAMRLIERIAYTLLVAAVALLVVETLFMLKPHDVDHAKSYR